MDCQLPVTGSSTLTSALLAVVVLSIGVALVWSVRRRGFGGGTAVVLALLLGTTAFAVTDARTADAAACPPATTTTTPAATTSTTTSTTAATTTTTTTAATTTTSTTTTTTTTTAPVTPVPDLTPSITGLATFVPPGPHTYTLTVTNNGTAATSGQLDISIDVSLTSGTGNLTFSNLGTAGQPAVVFIGSSGIPGGVNLAFQSSPSFVLAAAASITIPLDISWSIGPNGGTVLLQTTLPTGLGGETNGANNTASLTFTVLAT